MGQPLQDWIQQSAPISTAGSAMLNLIVAASRVEEGMQRIFEPYGITRRQYNVLRILRGVYPEGHARAEISARMLDRAPDVTRLVDRLIFLGLVERVKGTKDRRESITRLTAKGLSLVNELDPAIDHFIGHTFGDRYTKKECQLLSDLCERTYTKEL